MAIRNLLPTAIGTYNSWTLENGASKPAAVDPGDPPSHDDDASNLSVTASGVKQGFTLGNKPTAGEMASVNGVNWLARAKASGSSPVTARWILSAVEVSGGSQALGTTYTDLSLTGIARPGGGNWTPSDILDSSLEVIIQSAGASPGTQRCTSLWMQVDYNVPAGGFVFMLLSLLGPVFGAGVLLREVAAAARLIRGRVLLSPDEVRRAWAELRGLDGHSGRAGNALRPGPAAELGLRQAARQDLGVTFEPILSL